MNCAEQHSDVMDSGHIALPVMSPHESTHTQDGICVFAEEKTSSQTPSGAIDWGFFQAGTTNATFPGFNLVHVQGLNYLLLKSRFLFLWIIV